MSFVIEEEEVDRLPINIDPEIMSGTPVYTLKKLGLSS